MFESLNIQYPEYFIGLCLVLGLLYALVLYFKNQKWKEHRNSIPWILGVLRTLAVALIAYFLLVPILERFKSRSQNAIVVIAQDNSASISEGTDQAVLNAYKEQLANLNTALQEDFTVEYFQFGEEISVGKGDSLESQSTNISQALQYIEEQYSDQHIGAIIMPTDGIFNDGRNPLYVSNEMTAPFYPIALGDTTIRKDILIKNLLYNKIAYLGDKHEIQVDILGTNVAGAKSTVTLSKVVDGKTSNLDSKTVTFKSNNYFETVSFLIDANTPGAVQYKVSVSGVANELSQTNNIKSAYLDIIDARQEIFIIANAPHPDIHALNQSLTTNKNYKVSQYFAKDNIPIESADLVLFHNLPSSKYPIGKYLSSLDKKKKPRIYITGSQTDFKTFNSNGLGLRVLGAVGQTNESQAKFNTQFNKFSLSERLGKELKNYPPLIAPFGEYNLASTAEALISQTINGIDTNYPLIAFDQTQGIRKGFIAAEGIWKWRLFNYLQDNNHELFDELIKKVVQFVSVKDDKRKFRVNIAKTDYKVNEDILFDAQLYNDVYELTNVPEATLSIQGTDGKKYDYTLTRSNNYYTLNAGALKEGSYSYKATTNYNGKVLSANGKFRIESVQKESYNLTANHTLLYQLAEKYKGKVFLPSEINTIADYVKGNTAMKPLVFQEKDSRLLIHYPWMLLPILLLLAVEWFVRRYSGGY